MAAPDRSQRTAEFTTKVNEVTLRRTPPSEFEVHHLKRELNALKSVDPLNAYSLLGALAAVEGDIEAAHHNYRKAIANAPALHLPRRNYVSSLVRMAAFSEAVDEAKKAFAICRDQGSLIDYIRTCAFTGLFHEASRHMESLGKEESKMLEAGVPILPVRLAVGLSHGRALPEDWGAPLVAVLGTVLRASTTTILGIRLAAHEDDESEWLSYTVECRSASENRLSLNERFIEALVDAELPVSITTGMIVRFTSEMSNADHASTVA